MVLRIVAVKWVRDGVASQGVSRRVCYAQSANPFACFTPAAFIPLA